METNPYKRLIAKAKWDKDCLVFNGGLSGNGYGRFWFKGKLQMAHRAAWEMSGRTLTDGLTLDHICRNRRCINPTHLREVTSRENTLAGLSLAAINARKTHCPAGHEFSLENTYRYGKNRSQRRCRICARAAYNRYHLKLRSAQ